MKRLTAALLCLGCFAFSLSGTTLERLSLDEMIQKSTSIIRGKILSAASVRHGSSINTNVRVQVTEQLKGPGASIVEVTLPGGAMNGIRQMFAGVPSLEPGAEYVLFLWTSPRRVTHVIGLSQGVLNLSVDAKGDLRAKRAAIAATVVDTRTGGVVTPDVIDLSLETLRQHVRQTLAGAPR